MFLYVLLAVLTVCYFLYYYVTRTFNYWKDRNVVGPTPTALFGNLKESALRRKQIAQVFQEIYEQFPNEKVVGVFRMTTPCLLIRDLDIVRNIMIKDFDDFLDRGVEFSKEGLGANLFHADGDTWQVLRNRFTPLFTSGKLKNMFYLMTERGDKFIQYVEEICNQQTEQEVHTLVAKYTISTIAACAFGLDIEMQKGKMAELQALNEKLFNINFFNELDMMYPGVMKKLATSFFPKEVTQFFFDLTKTVIAERNGKPGNRKDFMDLILELRQQGNIQNTNRRQTDNLSLELTEGIIAAQAFAFYGGGFETSATTMAHLLFQLARNPDVQDKLIEEIDEVLDRTGGEVTYDCLKEMTYMTQVFDETLRMYPIVEPLQRSAKVNYKIPDTNVTIEKGQLVLISAMGIHHDEKYYPDPEKFDPERFRIENSKDRHPCAYLPFGTGPRNCIGMRFAKVQSRVCISKLLSKFRVEPSRNTQKCIEMDPAKQLLVNPMGGVYLNLIPRNK